MNNSRLLFLPALLVSILLFTVSNLKLGITINQFFNFIFFPLTSPIQASRSAVQNNLVYLQSLPTINQNNEEQKILIAHLIWENETLKQTLKDTKTQELLQNNFQQVIPIKVSGITEKIIATSSKPLTNISPGMPIVSGNILLGLVSETSPNHLNLISLEEARFPNISIRTATGSKGIFRFTDGTSQIVNVPSQTPLILGDFILTEATDLIPANLLIGKVTKILTSPQEPIQKAEISIYDTLQNAADNLVVILKP